MCITRSRLIAVLCAIMLFAAACGSDAPTTTAELPTIETSSTVPADTPDGAAGDADGDTSDADTDEATSEEPVDPEIAMAQYEQCMADEGVEVQMAVAGSDDGSGFETLDAPANDEDNAELPGGPPTFNQEDFEAAEEVCGPILEDAFGDFDLSPEQEAEMADQMLEFERCMADQGFEIDAQGGAFEIDESIDFEEFETAMQACNTAPEPAGAQG